MPKLGCLTLLLPVLVVLALLGLEAWVFWRVWGWLGDWLAPAVVVLVGTVGVGPALLRATWRGLPMALLGGQSGRLVVRGAAGLLITFPGLCTSAVGALLLIPGLDRLFKRLGEKVVAALMRQAMGKMMGGQSGGFSMFAKFQGGGPGAFPGMPGFGSVPRSPPDDQRPLPKGGPGGRTIDTTAERGDQR